MLDMDDDGDWGELAAAGHPVDVEVMAAAEMARYAIFFPSMSHPHSVRLMSRKQFDQRLRS